MSKLLNNIIQGSSPAELASRAGKGGEGAEATASLSGGSSHGFGDLLGSIKDCGKSLLCGSPLGPTGVAPIQQNVALNVAGDLGHFSAPTFGAGYGNSQDAFLSA